MSRGIVGLRGYWNGGTLDPDDDIPEWMRRLMEQLRRRGTPDQDTYRIDEDMQERITEGMGRPDWDPVNEEELAEFILGDPSEWDLPGLTEDQTRPPYNLLDSWHITANLQEQLGDLEPYDLSAIRRAYGSADPEDQELLNQLLRRGGMGAYEPNLNEDLLLEDFKSDPQSLEDVLEQVRNKAEMDDRYERAIQKYLEQNPDVDIHNIHESMDLDDLERLEREVLRGTPGGLTPDIDRIQDMTAAELEEAFGAFDDDPIIEELASRTESLGPDPRDPHLRELQEQLEELQRRREAGIASVDPVERRRAEFHARLAAHYRNVGGPRTLEEASWLARFFNDPGPPTPEDIAKFETMTGTKTAGPAPEPIYPLTDVPESRGATVGRAARRFARSLPWREIGMAGLMTAGKAVFPATVLGDVVQELAINPSEMGSGVPPWMEEGYRTPAEEQKFANDLMAARQDEEILPFTSGRYVPPAVPGAYSTWMPDDLEGIEQLQEDAARFMAGRRRVFRPVRPRYRWRD